MQWLVAWNNNARTVLFIKEQSFFDDKRLFFDFTQLCKILLVYFLESY